MEIPGLGVVTPDPRIKHWHRSGPIALPVFSGKEVNILVEGYDDDSNKDEYHTAIARFLACPPSVLLDAAAHIFAYYEDMASILDDEAIPRIASAQDIWKHVQLGKTPIVSRRAYGDRCIYVSVECECDWEPEHGLQIVFREGDRVCKIGQYDGHLTNADAWDDANLENIVYRRMDP
jgi:hypothetical protein